MTMVISAEAKTRALCHFLCVAPSSNEKCEKVFDSIQEDPNELDNHLIWEPFESYPEDEVAEWMNDLAIGFQEAMDSVRK